MFVEEHREMTTDSNDHEDQLDADDCDIHASVEIVRGLELFSLQEGFHRTYELSLLFGACVRSDEPIDTYRKETPKNEENEHFDHHAPKKVDVTVSFKADEI